jgi:hypothetical protein
MACVDTRVAARCFAYFGFAACKVPSCAWDQLCAIEQTASPAFGIRTFVGKFIDVSRFRPTPAKGMQMKTRKNLPEHATEAVNEIPKNDFALKSREENIAVMAYFRAQARGFGENSELDDWLAAEREFENARLEKSRAESKDL